MARLSAIHAGMASCAAIATLVAAMAGMAQAPVAAGAAADAGEALFAANCAGCHGTGLDGGRGPSLFSQALFMLRDDEQIRRIVTHGVAGTEMPAFGDILDDAEMTSVIAYLHGHARALQASPPSPGRKTDLTAYTPPNPDGQRIHSERQDFRIEAVAKGLSTPWALAFLPDGRLLVTERSPAQLRVIDAAGKLLPPVEGLPLIHQGQDAGLLDVAVGPDFATDGWVYIAYTDDDPKAPEPEKPEPGAPNYRIKRKPSMTVIVRGKIDADNRWTQQQDIFRRPYSFYTPSGSHYGSRLLFHDGHLYFSIGERGETRNAQDLATPLGKILRVMPDGSVPADNPFVGRKGADPIVWSYGHRNPEGLAIDPATGLMWESEHGPVGGDEINVIDKGGNYGWSTVSMGVQPGVTETAKAGMEPPAAWFFPTIAPSGITFYEGDRYPGWKGSLFVSALRGQQLRRLTVEGRKVTAQEVVFEQLGRVRDVATGPDGLLYVLITNPTGQGTGIDLTDPVPGLVVRLVPVEWRQPAKEK